MTRRGLVLLLGAAAWCASLLAGARIEPACADAGGVEVRASVDRARAAIGEPIRYAVAVTHPKGIKVTPPDVAQPLGGFEIERRGVASRERGGSIVDEHWYAIASFATGRHEIPAPVVTYRTPDGTTHEARGEGLTVTIDSQLPADWQSLDIRDVKPPATARRVPWWALGVALAGAALAVWWRLRKPRDAARAPSAPPPSPHEVAVAELAALRREGLLAAKRYEAFYVRLSDIIRRYIEGRFGVRAPDMTTEEFLQAAVRAQELTFAQQQLLADFLMQCDMVKFARYRPSDAEAEAALAAAERFVNETKPFEIVGADRRLAGGR